MVTSSEIADGQDGHGPGGHVDLTVWRDIAAGGWALVGLIDQELGASEVSIAEMRLLEAVKNAGAATISETAEMCHVRLSTISRQIARLIDRGALERVPDSSDGRYRLVQIAPAGVDLLNRAYEVRRRIVDEHVMSVLSEEEIATVADAFRRVRASVRGARPVD